MYKVHKGNNWNLIFGFPSINCALNFRCLFSPSLSNFLIPLSFPFLFSFNFTAFRMHTITLMCGIAIRLENSCTIKMVCFLLFYFSYCLISLRIPSFFSTSSYCILSLSVTFFFLRCIFCVDFKKQLANTKGMHLIEIPCWWRGDEEG